MSARNLGAFRPLAKLAALLVAATFVITSCSNQRPTTEASTVPAALQSESLTAASGVLFQHDFYDYGASIIQEGNIRKYWWCGQDPAATDAIFYRSYDSSTGQYSPILQVLSPNSGVNTWDRSYICDPSVIKGQFVNPDNNQTYGYAMYYTATDRGPGTPFAGTAQDGTNNRIGIAYSNDGIAWNRYSANPIIYPQVYPTDTYGAGQAATYSNNGIAGIQVFYSDFTNASSNLGERLYTRTSSNGRTFGAPTLISNQGVLPNQSPNMGNADFAFDYTGRYWYVASALSYSEAQGYRSGDRERYQFGLYRMSEATFPSGSWELLGYIDTNLTGATLNHNTSLVRDSFGNVNATSPNIETVFSQGSNAVNDWDLASVRWNSNPATSELRRYSSAGTNTFIVTTGFVPSGYALQNTVATLYNGRVTGTQPLYACKTGSTDYFVSLQLNCEGQYPLGVNGFIYSSQPSTPSTVALYRCYTGAGHFVSLQSNCEGSSNEGLLGYALGTGGVQPPTTTLTNTSLETPTVSGLQYGPSGATWSFASVAGIQRNGSAFSAATAPDGSQTAFLQGSSTGLGSMSQTVTLSAGTYSLKFKAAQRQGQVQPLKISLDGVQVGSNVTPTTNSFVDYSSSTFTVAAGSHVLKVEATNASGDNTVFLDSFSLQTSVGNLALNKPVTSNNSLESSQWGVAKITDGVLDSQATTQGYTSNEYSSANISSNPVYVEVDLGSNQNVGSVKLYPRTGSSAVGGGSSNFPVNFTVQVAVNGSSTYSTVATVTAQANPNGVAQTYSFTSTSARRIRILVTGLGSPASDEPTNYRFQLSELTVF